MSTTTNLGSSNRRLETPPPAASRPGLERKELKILPFSNPTPCVCSPAFFVPADRDRPPSAHHPTPASTPRRAASSTRYVIHYSDETGDRRPETNACRIIAYVCLWKGAKPIGLEPHGDFARPTSGRGFRPSIGWRSVPHFPNFRDRYIHSTQTPSYHGTCPAHETRKQESSLGTYGSSRYRGRIQSLVVARLAACYVQNVAQAFARFIKYEVLH